MRSLRLTSVTERPTVIFAYTIKAWRLATEGHPANHSARLSVEQWVQLAAATGADSEDPWARFADDTPEAELCRQAADRLRREPVSCGWAAAAACRARPGTPWEGLDPASVGRCFVDLAHTAPKVAAPVVIVSPDVASSTDLDGGINGVVVWHLGHRARLVRRGH